MGDKLGGSGADDRTKLELLSAPDLLSELEDWAEVLKGEPEVIHKLAVFAEAASGYKARNVMERDDGARTDPFNSLEPSP